jgi:hypothetical protein
MAEHPSNSAVLRFPKRLEEARKLGVEIAQTAGWFSSTNISLRGSRVKIASLERFQILHFTPFNQPTMWPQIDWDDRTIRLSLNGLSITHGVRRCLTVYWDNHRTYFDWVRPPSEDDWDRHLRDVWREAKPLDPLERWRRTAREW